MKFSWRGEIVPWMIIAGMFLLAAASLGGAAGMFVYSYLVWRTAPDRREKVS